jgi:hypothetical protein
MCDFPSWVEKGKQVFFLTDKDCMNYLRSLGSYDKTMLDTVGHTALRDMFPNLGGINKEGFPCPLEIVKAIIAGKCKKMMATNGYITLKFDDKGKLHCVDGPALVSKNPDDGTITTEYYQHGKLHRNDRPAKIEGTCVEYFQNGKRHCLTGPAIIYNNDFFYMNNEFWVKGKRISRNIFLRKYNYQCPHCHKVIKVTF